MIYLQNNVFDEALERLRMIFDGHDDVIVSMSGGKGSIVGTVLGMLIIGVMNNLLTLFGVPPFLREACKGVIVIVAVLLQKKEADA